MAHETDGLLREVEDELRRERYAKLWDKFGVYIMGVALLIVVGVAGGKFWQYWSAKQSALAGEKFISALDLNREKKTDEAAKVLGEISKSGPGGYQTLARFQLALQSAKAGKTEAAVEAYDKMAGDRSLTKVLQGYARINSAMLLLDSAGFAEIETRLNDLTKEDNPWRGTARELIGLSAYKSGSFDKARDQFSAILSGAGATPGLRQRAEMMMELLVTDQGSKTTDASDAPPSEEKKAASSEGKKTEGAKPDDKAAAKPAPVKAPAN